MRIFNLTDCLDEMIPLITFCRVDLVCGQVDPPFT